MAHRQIYFVTLDSADVVMIDRDIVKPQLRATLGRMLDGLRDHDEAIIPGPLPLMLYGRIHGRCLSATISTHLDGERADLVRFGCAKHSRCGSMLWQDLHTDGDHLKTAGRPQPRTPWLASRMLAGARKVPRDDLLMTASIARTIAAAWLDQDATDD